MSYKLSDTDPLPTRHEAGTEVQPPLPVFDDKFWKVIIDGVADPIFVKDELHRWVLFNEAFCQYLGYTREQLLGKSDPDFFPEDQAKVFWKNDDEVFAIGGETVKEEELTDANGKVNTIVTKKTVFTSADGKLLLVGIIRDITEAKQAQLALKQHHDLLEELVEQRTAELNATNLRLQQEIEERIRLREERQKLILQHQKSESLWLMAGGIAHDFNNLLVGILGNADLALSHIANDHPSTYFIGEVKNAAQSAVGLTNHLMAYSGRGLTEIKAVDLNQVYLEMLDLLNTAISTKACLSHEIADNLPSVNGDSTLLHQVILNLVVNASEAIKGDSGTIIIKTQIKHHCGGLVPNGILNWELPQGDYVCFSVQDNGVGLDPERRELIFDPFVSTKQNGRGLGLSAVLGIVRSHNGAVAVQSSPGVGSIFEVLLPVSSDKAPAVREVSEVTRIKVRRDTTYKPYSGTVLVIDDEQLVRSVLKDMLAVMGFEVQEADSGAAGLKLLEHLVPEPVLVVVDLSMPSMSGAEVMNTIRSKRPHLPIILTSGYGEIDAIEWADVFLPKPFTFSSLQSKVRESLDF
ncbi:MAG TPA: ATP-binding protein [Myxococcota bacterium]|mgnify:FL=1|nr:ATP-binding protein [Myxococcota bacterium]HOS61499.1 ATP-binding protein [Myxococcota bacterium]HPC91242.1 ATP-binding protein [Myxococcota bacterium]HPL25059.1 ATP-binding protein [Myxococcota bacterium]HRR73927.1 ATP-binding protein [Myxococcota bacterium]